MLSLHYYNETIKLKLKYYHKTMISDITQTRVCESLEGVWDARGKIKRTSYNTTGVKKKETESTITPIAKKLLENERSTKED